MLFNFYCAALVNKQNKFALIKLVFFFKFHALLNEHSTTLSKKYLKNYDAETIDYDFVNGALKNEEIIENTLLAFLQKHFSQHPCYIPVIELFHEVTLKASIGKVCGELFVKNNKPDFEKFTMKRYRTLVRYNNVSNTFVLPVALAMFLARKYNWEMHRQARTVLLETGHFHQVRVSKNSFRTIPSIRSVFIEWRSRIFKVSRVEGDFLVKN